MPALHFSVKTMCEQIATQIGKGEFGSSAKDESMNKFLLENVSVWESLKDIKNLSSMGATAASQDELLRLLIGRFSDEGQKVCYVTYNSRLHIVMNNGTSFEVLRGDEVSEFLETNRQTLLSDVQKKNITSPTPSPSPSPPLQPTLMRAQTSAPSPTVTNDSAISQDPPCAHHPCNKPATHT